MMVIGRVGIEIRAPRLDDGLAQQPGFGELVQRIVKLRQGHRDPRDHCFPVQLFGSDVPVAVFQKELRQGKPLSRRPQTGLAQPPEGSGEWRSAFHAVDMGRRDPKANTGIAGLRCATVGRRRAAIEVFARGALGKGYRAEAGDHRDGHPRPRARDPSPLAEFATAGTRMRAILHAAGGALLAGRFTTIPHIKSAAPPQRFDQV